MKMLGASVVLCLLLVGCAQHPAGGERPGPEATDTSGADQRARIHTELAAQYYARASYAIALQELKESLESDSRYAPAYNMLGLVHGALREDDKADEAFRRAIELSSSYSEAHNNYGWFLCDRGKIDMALTQFEKALANPLYASPDKALANAGLCLLRANRVQQAEEYLQRALIRSPYQPVALYQMARLHFMQGRAVPARNNLLRLGEFGPLDAPALWLGVRVERKLGDQAAESSYAAQLRRRYPNSQETYWLSSGQYDQPGAGS